MRSEICRKWTAPVCAALLAVSIFAGTAAAGAAKARDASGQAASPEKKSDKKTAAKEDPNRITRQGLVVEFSMRPTHGGPERLIAGDWADVTFRITDAISGKPLQGSYPAAWMDLTEGWMNKGSRVMDCQDWVKTYLQGLVGVRPMIDLNSHFLLVLNRDASISVIDPTVGITGITNLFAQINLAQPGADWDKTADEKRMFVAMPLADEVALIDTDIFKVVSNVEAGKQPTRVELQRDERYLWVGNNARKPEESGVTVIDAVEFKWRAFIPTGRGHHEIAFSDGDRYAFVSNRDEGTVTVIDVKSLKKVKDLKTGPKPISLGFSPLGKALYVVDAEAGTVAVVDPAALEIRARIEVGPGLGPLRFSQDGRWGLVVNPAANTVVVIDAATNRVAHRIPVGEKPYQVSFTQSFAYVRALGSPEVGLIPMSEFEGSKTPPVTFIPAGQGMPGAAAEISIADSIVPSVKHAAVYIVNQAEGTVHYYMEGMAAPMGAFRNYGHETRAIEIVDRSLGEWSPGVYAGRVRPPVEGTYNIAFMMDAPRFVHCFSAKVEPNPKSQAAAAAMAVEYQVADRRVPAGSSTKVKFKLTEPATGKPRENVTDVTVMYYGLDGRGRTVVPARPLGKGLYEADVKVERVTTYYVFVGSRSLRLNYTDLPFLSLMGTPAPVSGSGAKAGAGGSP